MDHGRIKRRAGRITSALHAGTASEGRRFHTARCVGGCADCAYLPKPYNLRRPASIGTKRRGRHRGISSADRRTSSSNIKNHLFSQTTRISGLPGVGLSITLMTESTGRVTPSLDSSSCARAAVLRRKRLPVNMESNSITIAAAVRWQARSPGARNDGSADRPRRAICESLGSDPPL